MYPEPVDRDELPDRRHLGLSLPHCVIGVYNFRPTTAAVRVAGVINLPPFRFGRVSMGIAPMAFVQDWVMLQAV